MAEPDQRRMTHARRTTGVPGLDTILHGGLIPASVYIVQGTPGAGKTILANQICFHQAAQGAQCLYMTLLAESHDRMLEQLRALDFFDGARVPESIYYVSAFGALERDGPDGILRLLTHERKTHSASLIVLDGLFVLEETARSEAAFRKFINNLSGFAYMSGSTILLLTNNARHPRSPEYTMVDGWLELGIQQIEYLSLRYMQVHKFRGSNFIAGQHATRISEAGIQIFPRLESSVGRARSSQRPKATLLTTGVPGLDQMLGGGLRSGSTTLLVGPTGIGKTTFGLAFLGACTPEAPGLFFGFYEDEADLIEKADSLGMALAPLISAGTVEVMWQPVTEDRLDELGYRLLEAVRRRGVKRLFIDGVNAFQLSTVSPQRIGRYLAAITSTVRAEGVTAMSTYEIDELIGGEARVRFGAISATAQNIILLRYVELEGQTQRTLAVVKVRSSRFDTTIRTFTISNGGPQIGAPLRQADDVLTGHAHPRGTDDSS